MNEFLSCVLGLYVEWRIEIATRNASRTLAATHRERDAAWAQYADAMDKQLVVPARTVVESSGAWTKEQREFHELADTV